ncbi:DUF1593 domain-containing protein [Thermoflavifilum thermophilum]|uniref:DUF1593 domain-containing protein n=1 Tax=Thermoflavifilum thermophilum TaxID=1393122 RepID=A0A1I7N9I8_9BACT|nr:DUF1593 domain-containing protein [Thermoflavifilum thermophilum]SFV31325.1 Protein of unknown function [Thermoflavifilum thermophilum]
MKHFRFILLVCILNCLAMANYAQQEQKNRLIVLTDVGAEVDDMQSLIRLLLYSNEIDIQGLVATTSVWMKNRVHPEIIRKLILDYGRVRPNLLQHEPGFPPADSLLRLVKSGNPAYGMEGVGEGKNSEGSDWIIRMLEKPDDRPLWIAIWGGANTLAQALYELRTTRSAAEVNRLIAKLRVYAISDQDDSGHWIRTQFPNLFYIVSPGDDYGRATWIGITMVVKGIDNEEISNDWIAEHIQEGHGPLGADYPDVAYGMEGDTPSFLSLIPNGLNAPEHPDWGGWGGRYALYLPHISPLKKGISGVPIEPETRPIWTDTSDTYRPFVHRPFGKTVGEDTLAFTGNQVTLWRWRKDFQNDFAARMDWCTKPYREANHPPVVQLKCPAQFTVKSGQVFWLNATATDPDGDHLSYLWFNYPEAGTYGKPVSIASAENMQAVSVVAPQVTHPVTLHFIVRVTDMGKPPLARYKRVMVTVMP